MSKRLGNGMILMAWIILLGMMTFFFSRYLDRQHNPNQQVASRANAEFTEITLQQNRFGHYVATGRINGTAAVFLLDTGATMISVPGDLAGRLGLERGPPMTVNTANGAIRVYATRLETVELGDIVLHDVRASINPWMDGEEVLLGMNFLKQLELIQQGETLTLRQYK